MGYSGEPLAGQSTSGQTWRVTNPVVNIRREVNIGSCILLYMPTLTLDLY